MGEIVEIRMWGCTGREEVNVGEERENRGRIS